MKKAYVTTIVSANAGLIIGALVGYVLALSTDILNGDPNAEAANLALILIAIALMSLTGGIGSAVATYLGLRVAGASRAIRTTLYVAGLYAAGLGLSLFIPPLGAPIFVSPLLARYLALK